MLLTTRASTPIENAASVRCEVVALQTQKAGNQPHECEDSAAFDADHGRIALSDGAGEGIFSREWSRLLVDNWLHARPDLTDPEAAAGWLDRCRRAWFGQIDHDRLGWAHRARVDRHGTGATLLTLRFFRSTDGVAFHVQAVGDSCLFWMRGDHCLGLFPLAGSDEFADSPELFSTHGDAVSVAASAAGDCEPGDRFLLASDAVSCWLCRQLESGQTIDVARFRSMSQDDWQREIDARRNPHNRDDPHAPPGIENDDCTMLVVSVARDANLV